MVDRAAFERRIAAAIWVGQSKIGSPITRYQAAVYARQVVDKLPALFTES